MIEIRDIKDKPCELYGPDNKLIGIVDNELSFEDIRLQIQQEKAEGYYIKFEGKTYQINKYGALSTWPNGLFDTAIKLSTQILQGSIKDKKLEEDIQKIKEKVKEYTKKKNG